MLIRMSYSLEHQATVISFMVPDVVGDVTLKDGKRDLLGTLVFDQTKDNLAAVGILVDLAAKAAK
jgi:hypothetical protein